MRDAHYANAMILKCRAGLYRTRGLWQTSTAGGQGSDGLARGLCQLRGRRADSGMAHENKAYPITGPPAKISNRWSPMLNDMSAVRPGLVEVMMWHVCHV